MKKIQAFFCIYGNEEHVLVAEHKVFHPFREPATSSSVQFPLERLWKNFIKILLFSQSPRNFEFKLRHFPPTVVIKFKLKVAKIISHSKHQKNIFTYELAFSIHKNTSPPPSLHFHGISAFYVPLSLLKKRTFPLTIVIQTRRRHLYNITIPSFFFSFGEGEKKGLF